MTQGIQDGVMQSPTVDRRFWGFGVVLVAAFLFCFAKLFAVLVHAWWTNDVYSHGFLVPFVSIYIVWMQRDRLSHIQCAPGYLLGIVILLVGLSMLLAGHIGGVLVFLELSLIVTIIGIVMLVFGKHLLKALWLPISYLIFMLTIWGTATAKLHFPFQNFTANFATKLLQFIGIPAFRESIYIELPNITLKVALVCSGVNYLIAVAAVGIPLAYIALKSWKRRFTLVVGGLLIAILANSLRVTLIGTLAYYDMAGDLHGPYHMLQAMFVSVIGFIGLFVGAWLLSEPPDGDPPVATMPDRSAPSVPERSGQGSMQIDRIKFPLFLAVGFLLIFGGYVNFYQVTPVPLRMNIEMFPTSIGGWRGASTGESGQGVFRSPGVDRELTRTYATADGRKVRLYIGYYAHQEQGKELANHRTQELHRGASKVSILLDSERSIDVGKVEAQEGTAGSRTIFWYYINGRVITDRYKAQLFTALSALTRARTNGAVVVVTQDLKGSPKDVEDFARVVMPALSKHLP